MRLAVIAALAVLVLLALASGPAARGAETAPSPPPSATPAPGPAASPAAPPPSIEEFSPREQLPADAAVSFPVDI